MTLFDQFLAYNQEQNIAEYVCLSAQFVLTALAFNNLLINWNKFPILQSSPLCTLLALTSFFVINIVSFVGKVVEESLKLYEPSNTHTPINGQCGQCRTRNNSAMLYLSLAYMFLRQFPQIIFILKTFRVCLCSRKFLPRSGLLVRVFNKQYKILAICFFYSTVAVLLNYIDFTSDENQTKGRMVFQYLCPKESDWSDWILTALRNLLMFIVYLLSQSSNKQINFKEFLIVIFILNNSQVLIRIVLYQFSLNQTTYHQFHYHSLLIHLFMTVLLLRESEFKKDVVEPPFDKVLDSFESFYNWNSSHIILDRYARHLDGTTTTQHSTILQLYRELTFIYNNCYTGMKQPEQFQEKLASIYSSIHIPADRVVKMAETKRQIDGLIDKKQEFNTDSLIPLKNYLLNYCITNIYEPYIRTHSCKFLREEFELNAKLCDNMLSLNIEIKQE